MPVHELMATLKLCVQGDGHHCGPGAVGQVVGRRDVGAGCSVWGLCSEGQWFHYLDRGRCMYST